MPVQENIVLLGYGVNPLIVSIGLIGGQPATSAAAPKENIVILGYGQGPLIPTIGLVGAPASAPSGVVPKENIVILGYGQGPLIATIGLVGGEPAPTPPPSGGQAFGGGPFWREYGYDSAYDAIRNQTSTAIPESPPFVAKPIDHHFIQKRAFGAVEMRAFWEAELRERSEEEIMIILSLLE